MTDILHVLGEGRVPPRPPVRHDPTRPDDPPAGASFVDRVTAQSDPQTRRAAGLQTLFDHGQLGGTVTCRSCRWIRV